MFFKLLYTWWLKCFPLRCLAKQIYCKKCLHFHWVCNFPITDHQSIIATIGKVKEWHSGEDLARMLHDDSPWGLTYTFNLSKCAAPRTLGFATPANCSPHSWETGDRWGKAKKICIRAANNGDKDITIVPFTRPTLFWLGPPKHVSKQAKLHLIRRHGINPNIVLCRSVYMGLCQRLRGWALMRTCWKKKR